MAKIKASDILTLFGHMLDEHWAYEWGAAREGCVDCSGAFVYAYKQLGGPAISHGSNSIFRQSIGAADTNPHPGWAAFKCKPWTGDDAGNRWYGDKPGNISHIGLVDASGQRVLNAKGTAYGFCRDNASGYQFFAPLLAVDYAEEESKMEILYYAQCTGDQVRVRDDGGVIVGHINRGDVVPVMDDSNPEWIRVGWNGRVCKVSGKYLVRVSDSAEHANSTADDDAPGDCATTTLYNSDGARITLVGAWRIAGD